MGIPSGVAAKLDRADEHVENLRTAVDEFLSSEPFRAERTLSPDGREHIVRWTKTTPIPFRIPLIAGDAVHNLRSALDHLALEIARRCSSSKLTREQERKVHFPVARTKEVFCDQVVRYFGGITPKAFDAMYSIQPFSFLMHTEHSLLLQVSELDNIDKHRMLVSTPIAPVVAKPPWASGVHAEWESAAPGPFSPGVEIGRYRFAKPTSEASAPVTFQFGITLSPPWNYKDIRFRFSEYANTIRGGVVVPICNQLGLQ